MKTGSSAAISMLVILVAISLNILFTLKFNDTHIGIRIAATDFFIPVAIVFLLITIAKDKKIPELIEPYGWKLLGLMSLWMTVSLVKGYVYIGSLMTWALVNKYLGWFVLMSYFMTGVYIGMLENKKRILFVRVLLITAWIICLAELLVHWVFAHGYYHEYSYVSNHYRMQGFYQNPNAFGIFLSALFIIHLYIKKKSIVFSNIVLSVGSAIILLCIFYSYSRSAWLGLMLALLVSVVLDKRMIFNILISFFLAYILNFIAFSDYTKNINVKFIEFIYADTQKMIANTREIIIDAQKWEDELTVIDNDKKAESKTKKIIAPGKVGENINIVEKAIVKKHPTQLTVRRLTAVDRLKSDGLTTRLEILKRSMGYWSESPITGIGLGGHIWNSQKEGIPADSVTIHNSLNWLLVETGIIGTLIFSAFILLCLRSLYYAPTADNSFLSPQTMISIMFLIIGASIATEVIYQRYFWLILGIFLVKTEGNKKTGD